MDTDDRKSLREALFFIRVYPWSSVFIIFKHTALGAGEGAVGTAAPRSIDEHSMTLFSGIVVFTVIWWLVLFTVLPWGVRRTEDPEPGHAVEAPANPRILLKFAITTAIAAVLFAIAWWLIESDLITFREP